MSATDVVWYPCSAKADVAVSSSWRRRSSPRLVRGLVGARPTVTTVVEIPSDHGVLGGEAPAHNHPPALLRAPCRGPRARARARARHPRQQPRVVLRLDLPAA